MVLGFGTGGVTEAKLLRLLEFVTRENTAFFLGRLRAGQSVQTASEAGLRYCPDHASSHEVVLLDAGVLLDQGVGSCGSIAAHDAAVYRSRAQHQGTPSPVASGRFAPHLIRQPSTEVDYWHAVVRTPDGLVDPSRHLQQVCVTPSYA
jgi:hypothetical protein